MTCVHVVMRQTPTCNICQAAWQERGHSGVHVVMTCVHVVMRQTPYKTTTVAALDKTGIKHPLKRTTLEPALISLTQLEDSVWETTEDSSAIQVFHKASFNK